MKLTDLTSQLRERAAANGGRVYLTDKQVAFALTLAHRAQLPGLPLNQGYTPLPGKGRRYAFDVL
jgi:hypothetical protein